MARAEQKESMKIVPAGKKKCVWMEAGVGSYKLCDNNYDCPTCAYDHAMQLKVARQKEAASVQPEQAAPDKFNKTWVDKMMMMPASRRKCRYMITGEVERKLCPNAYECGTCSFDRMMQSRVQAEGLPVQASDQVGGFKMAQGFYYNKGHVWARPEYGGRVRVGLDDFAQKLLGKLSAVETPALGHEVQKDAPGFRLKRNGEVVAGLSPVDGTVIRINDRLLDHPELINSSPYEDGWLFVVEPSQLRKNTKELLFGEEADAYLVQEKERLMDLASEEMRLAADGGEVSDDIFNDLGGEAWAKVVKTFLRS